VICVPGGCFGRYDFASWLVVSAALVQDIGGQVSSNQRSNTRGDVTMKIEASVKSSEKAGLLHVEFGGRLLVTIDGMERNLWSTLIGIEPDNCLIIRTPKIDGIESKLHKENQVNITYFFAGTVYGFQSKILNNISFPTSLIFISYPNDIKRIELREHQRVDCCLPGHLGVAEQEYNGMILDLSTNGCRFSMIHADQPLFPYLDIGDELSLKFIIPGSEAMRTLKGKVKNIIRDTKKMNMGVQFTNLYIEIITELEAYIKGIIDFAGIFPE
jgi:c-di-GMP-binding flagellar brake protein YcgR